MVDGEGGGRWRRLYMTELVASPCLCVSFSWLLIDDEEVLLESNLLGTNLYLHFSLSRLISS